jgi:hypothetical protein
MHTKRVRVSSLAGLLAVLFHIHLTAASNETLLDAIRRDCQLPPYSGPRVFAHRGPHVFARMGATRFRAIGGH